MMEYYAAIKILVLKKRFHEKKQVYDIGLKEKAG